MKKCGIVGILAYIMLALVCTSGVKAYIVVFSLLFAIYFFFIDNKKTNQKCRRKAKINA